jgi:hypothetical protein
MSLLVSFLNYQVKAQLLIEQIRTDEKLIGTESTLSPELYSALKFPFLLYGESDLPDFLDEWLNLFSHIKKDAKYLMAETQFQECIQLMENVSVINTER